MTWYYILIEVARNSIALPWFVPIFQHDASSDWWYSVTRDFKHGAGGMKPSKSFLEVSESLVKDQNWKWCSFTVFLATGYDISRIN